MNPKNKKKISFCKNAKTHDGLSMKATMIITIFKLYVSRPFLVISHIREILPRMEDRQFVFNHFSELCANTNKETQMVQLMSHIPSGFIIHNTLQLMPLLNSLRSTLQ